MSIGEKAWLPLPSDNRVQIGDKSLVSLNRFEDSLSLLAKKKGRTSLLMEKKHYDLFIFSKDKKTQALKLEALLSGFWGLSWSVSKEGVFQIKGVLNRLYDWLELSQLAERDNILYHFKALPGENLKPLIQEYMEKLFQNKASPEILWSFMPFVHIPKGAALSEYESLLRPFGLIPKEDPLWFAKKTFIDMEIALVESLSSSSFAFGGDTDVKDFLFSFSSLFSFLSFLKNSGRGKTLHHSRVKIQSGQKIQIHSGGQIPFHSYNMKTEQRSVQWKAYGLQLDIFPKLDKKNQIEIEIGAKISEPLAYVSTEGPPPLKTQSLKSKILLKNKQIVQLFQLQKNSKTLQSHGQFSFFSPFLNSLLSGKNRYAIQQFVFLQFHIKEGH